MKNDTKTEMNTQNLKDKMLSNNMLIVNFLELILMKNILICMLKLVKYTITLIDYQDFKRLSEPTFKSNHLIKSKCLKYIVKKYCHDNKTMQNLLFKLQKRH